ncbi:MAG: LPS export ABC transporter periplasmic protein LptC [Bacteroidetes bacterium]|nr:LPS export ABC transporter periplasmic protein LptC [Bacteroidota bacterium]
MTKLSLMLILLLMVSIETFAQKDEKITILGDSLVGKYIDGQNIREILGNVVMTQGNVRITCKKAIQYLARNEAELIGDVVAVQDSITIYTERGFYFGNEKYTFSETPVKLNDGHITLTADKGYYYFDDDRAEFFNNVKLKDSVNTLLADQLIYYNNLDKAVSIGNVKIFDDKSEITADSLVHFRNKDLSYGYSNIKIQYPENNVIITGGYLKDDGVNKYTFISQNPALTQIDTSDNGQLDTLIVISKVMEAYQDSTKKLVASDSVKVIRSSFYSINNYSIMFRAKDEILTYKLETDVTQPIVWYENSQLTGDTVKVKFKDKKIKWIDVLGNSFVLSKEENYENRFNQISGERTIMYFDENKLQKTEVIGNVLSYYYVFEEDEPNGVLKSSSERAKLLFKDNTVSDVKLYGSIKSEFHPENLIKGKEREFTLPSFVLYTNKPDKKNILDVIPNFGYKKNGSN